MKIKVTSLEIKTETPLPVPAYFLEPSEPEGGVLVMHGFKSSRDYMMGLGIRIAEEGFSVLLPDQRGAGENKNPPDLNFFCDIIAGLEYLKNFSFVAMVGYSLNGFTALCTEASAIVSISPPSLEIIKARAIEKGLFTTQRDNIFSGIPFNRKSPMLILYGENDLEGFPEAAIELSNSIPGSELMKIPGAYHSDICYRPEVLYKVPRWLKEKLVSGY